jgi:pimeloyl-ACP methyl ester carboxylesterase
VLLKCTPEHEAQTFEGTGKITIGQVGSVTTATVIARGGREGEFGPAGFAGAVASALPNGELRRYDELSHFGPFEDPVLLAREAAAFLAN